MRYLQSITWLVLTAKAAAGFSTFSATTCLCRSGPDVGVGANNRRIIPAVSTVSSDQGVSLENDEGSALMKDAVIVGSLTAAMGYIYGKILSFCVQSMWHELPAWWLSQGRTLDPRIFITGVCTFGGSVVGLLSLAWRMKSFTVADHVLLTSARKELPNAAQYLFPLLILSLLTSTFGFSVGPEAPMVCAGALVGSAYSRWRRGDSEHGTVLSYSGAAGALTAFMGIPVAGSIFALELTNRSAGFGPLGDKALPCSIAASCAGWFWLRTLFEPNKAIGGHFHYPSLGGPVHGFSAAAITLTAGVGGAVIGRAFVELVNRLKQVCWSEWPLLQGPVKNKEYQGYRYRPVLVKTLIGLVVGLLSSRFPQTLFWGEGSLQCMIDGQSTPFGATHHGLSKLLTSTAFVDPSIPFQKASEAFSLGAVKLLSIALACAGKFPGGIIFPLFFASAPLAHALALATGKTRSTSLLVMSLMASTQASVTKTPLATALILSLSASPFAELSVLWPVCLISSYLGVWTSERLSRTTYFTYDVPS